MAHFSIQELLFPDRGDLPRVKHMAERAGAEPNEDRAAAGAARPEDHAMDPGARRWRILLDGDECSAAGVAHSQRLQYLCLKQIVRSYLVVDPRRCKLGFESDFAAILAHLMDDQRRGGGATDRDWDEDGPMSPRRSKRSRAESGEPFACKRSYPASFMDYQRIIRSSIFFSPYLKYSFQMNIIDCTMTEVKVASLNPHFFSTTSSSGQGQVLTPADASSVGFYASLARDSERDCATLKVTFLGLPSTRLVVEVLLRLLAEFSADGLLHKNHVLLCFQSYFECLPRRVHASRDLVKFSASFPRGHAVGSDWEEYLDRTVHWCERLMTDTSLLCETPGDASTLRPRVDVRRPVEETRIEGPRNHRDMIHYKSVNYQDHMIEEFM